MFVAMGLSAAIPVLHGIKIYGMAKMTGLMGMPWVVLQGVLYVLGAGIYAVCTNPLHLKVDTHLFMTTRRLAFPSA